MIDDSLITYAPATRAPLVEWGNLDVSRYIGHEAHIEIVDSSYTGYIMLDNIMMSNELKLGPAKKTFIAEKRYLLLPVKGGGRQYRLRLEKKNDVDEQFVIEMATGKPDFWAFKDISAYKGRKMTLSAYCPGIPESFDQIYQSDTIPGERIFYKEEFRPQLHFTTKQGWINDPNGLVYYKGQWHLMYQHNPYGIIRSLKHWGHAVSTDLIHWKEMPSSVVPDDNGSNHSGGAVVDFKNSAGLQKGDEKTLIAFWTAAGHFTSPSRKFTQCISYSRFHC